MMEMLQHTPVPLLIITDMKKLTSEAVTSGKALHNAMLFIKKSLF